MTWLCFGSIAVVVFAITAYLIASKHLEDQTRIEQHKIDTDGKIRLELEKHKADKEYEQNETRMRKEIEMKLELEKTKMQYDYHYKAYRDSVLGAHESCLEAATIKTWILIYYKREFHEDKYVLCMETHKPKEFPAIEGSSKGRRGSDRSLDEL